MTIDSGGSIAIKGFNYQKAVIAYIAVLNYQKNGFQIIVENQDDVEVFIEDRKAFIQIKSEKLSLGKICKQDKNSNKSILGKLFDKNHKNALYKIVTTNKFSETDKSCLEKVCGYLLPCDVFKYSSEQRKKFSDSLLLENYSIDEINSRIDRCFLVISPFEDKYENAIPFLLGVMSDKNISVDGNRGRAALNELFTQIDAKSELDPKKHQGILERKQILKEDLDKIFLIVDKEGYRGDLRKEILDECGFSKPLKFRILKEFFNLYTIHRSLKNKITDELGGFSLNIDHEAAQVKELHSILNPDTGDKSAVYAVLIELMVDKILGNNSDR